MFFFAVWAGAQAPPKQQKKKNAPAQTEKKKTRPRLFRACFFVLLFGRVGVFIFFCCLGGGRVFVFAVWAGGVVFFLLFGWGRVLFLAVWAGACSFLWLFGPGACSFFCC